MNFKIKIITVFALVTYPYCGFGQNFQSSLREADLLYAKNDFQACAEKYEEAIIMLDEKYISPSVFYNCACAFSLGGDLDKAAFYLNKAILRGSVSVQILNNDTDLTNVRESKKWKDIEVLTKRIEAGKDTILISALKKLSINDKYYRKKIDSLMRNKISGDSVRRRFYALQDELDSLDLIAAKLILDTRGYPTRIESGNLSNVLFMVIQHSDLVNMEKYYDLFEAAADKGDLLWSELASMSDRIRKRKGEKQLYGSQVIRIKNNEYTLYEVEDIEHLNERRLKIGLDTIEEYVQYWGIKL